jgi:hypothetical protein
MALDDSSSDCVRVLSILRNLAVKISCCEIDSSSSLMKSNDSNSSSQGSELSSSKRTTLASSDEQSDENHSDFSMEELGCSLWDFCVDQRSAQFLLDHNIIDILNALLSTPHPKCTLNEENVHLDPNAVFFMPTTSPTQININRMFEIAIGIAANLVTSSPQAATFAICNFMPQVLDDSSLCSKSTATISHVISSSDSESAASAASFSSFPIVEPTQTFAAKAMQLLNENPDTQTYIQLCRYACVFYQLFFFFKSFMLCVKISRVPLNMV